MAESLQAAQQQTNHPSNSNLSHSLCFFSFLFFPVQLAEVHFAPLAENKLLLPLILLQPSCSHPPQNKEGISEKSGNQTPEKE